MSSPRRFRKSRRIFLQSIPTFVAGAAVRLPHRALDAKSLSAGAGGSRADYRRRPRRSAQQLIGLNLPPGERESARPLVSRNRDNYEADAQGRAPDRRPSPLSAFASRFPHDRAEIIARGASRLARQESRAPRSVHYVRAPSKTWRLNLSAR